MGVHNVVWGDTLWGIVKNTYNLTNNTEIANMVKKVADANGIDEPDLIYAGTTIKLVDIQEAPGDTFQRTTTPETDAAEDVEELTDVEETEAAEETTVVTETETEEEAEQSQNQNTGVSETVQQAINTKIESKNIETYDDIERAENTTVNLFASDATDTEKDKAYTDFSNGILKTYDADNDGTVTVEEFAKKEYDDGLHAYNISSQEFGGGEADESGKLLIQRFGNMFAQSLDINQNGKIDTAEMNFFNRMADELDGAKDGQISAKFESAAFNTFIGLDSADLNFSTVAQKYYGGGQLTEEEQKIFDEGMQDINKTMREQSGLE